jgi:hypothetical protein
MNSVTQMKLNKIGQVVAATVIIIMLLLIAAILFGFLAWVAVWVWGKV